MALRLTEHIYASVAQSSDDNKPLYSLYLNLPKVVPIWLCDVESRKSAKRFAKVFESSISKLQKAIPNGKEFAAVIREVVSSLSESD